MLLGFLVLFRRELRPLVPDPPRRRWRQGTLPHRRPHWGLPRVGTAGRLLALNGVVLAAVMGVVLIQVIRDFTVHYQSTVAADLGDELTGFSAAFRHRPAGQTLEAFSRSYLLTHPVPAGEIVLIALPHQPVLGSGHAADLARVPTVRRALAKPPVRTRITQFSVGKAPYLALTSPILEGTSAAGVVVAADDLSRLQSESNQVALLAAVEAGVALLVALLSAYLILRRVLRTVGAVTSTAVEASQGELDRRIGYRGVDDEVGRMAAAFDGMLSKISSTVASQRNLLQDVSHQLRTPLTVAKGHLEVLRRSGSDDPVEVAETTSLVVEELDQMSSMVDQLLLLGHSLEPDFIRPEPVDLRSFMADLATSAAVLGDRDWRLDPVPDAVVLIDPARIRGALLNLLDNSVKATAPGEEIRLFASCRGDLSLGVADRGSGIPEELRPLVFDRFRRSGSGRGSGLGLAIVRVVAEGHRGRVELASEIGRGTTVTMVLPPECVRPDGGEPE